MSVDEVMAAANRPAAFYKCAKRVGFRDLEVDDTFLFEATQRARAIRKAKAEEAEAANVAATMARVADDVAAQLKAEAKAAEAAAKDAEAAAETAEAEAFDQADAPPETDAPRETRRRSKSSNFDNIFYFVFLSFIYIFLEKHDIFFIFSIKNKENRKNLRWK